jgi:hypothetical protein
MLKVWFIRVLRDLVEQEQSLALQLRRTEAPHSSEYTDAACAEPALLEQIAARAQGA